MTEGSSVDQPKPSPTSSRLDDLYRHFEQDPAVVDRFVADYMALLDERLAAIGACLAQGSTDDAVISILSLESTSSMIGAEQVVQLSHRLRVAVADLSVEVALEVFAELTRAAATLRQAVFLPEHEAAELGSAQAAPSS